jgi:hypothetical protein
LLRDEENEHGRQSYQQTIFPEEILLLLKTCQPHQDLPQQSATATFADNTAVVTMDSDPAIAS